MASPGQKRGNLSQTKTFETRAAAEQGDREIEYEMDRGIFVSRAEAESTTLRELLERYREEVTPLKKGAAPESARIDALLRHPLSARIVASLRGVDIAGYRDERLKKVSPATVKPDLVVQLALETAMRQGELVGLRWEHVDLARRIAYLPDTKNGEARTVPLSSTAVNVLRALPRSIHGQVDALATTSGRRCKLASVRPEAKLSLRRG